MTDRDDAESAFRRGYQQGAFMAMEAAERLTGKQADLRPLREWAELTLVKWRYHDRPTDGTVPPPVPPS
jgi:ribosome modulation factor